MQLSDVQIDFINGQLTCRGRIHAQGATPHAITVDGNPVSKADSFILHAPEGGKLVTEEGVMDMPRGDYYFRPDGISFRGSAPRD